MRERVRPPKDEPDNVLDRLKDDGVFESKQKGLMFAAAVGFALHRDELDGLEVEQFGEGIRLSVFGDDEAFIEALAAATREDLAVLAAERQVERVEMFEKYAVLGLRDLKRVCYDERPDYALSGVLTLLDQLNRAGSGDLPGLEGLF